ncbi:MAG TPA: Si-specific NAD(P)(+) transhydrogenase [Polyangiaceae bacterium]|nr:Si-specific NAD(P)(+) transhydrogenase [Polyangiaceae bacterium]
MSRAADTWDLVVLGSGPAGQKAAIQAAKAGRRALVVEQDSTVGGACVHRGTIPSKTLRETALAFSAYRRKSGDVVDATMPEEVQIAALTARMDGVILAHEKFIDDQLRRNGVEVWHGRARFTSPEMVEVVEVSGRARRARGKAIVIATGSRPRDPDEIPIDHENVFDSDSMLSMRYLPRSLTVLGGGVIASEYASIFAALGVEVIMVDKAPRPLGFVDGEVVSRFVTAFERAAGRFVGGAKIERVEFDGLATVETTLGSGEVLRTDKLLCALGRVANVEGLCLEAAGLSVNARGLIAVDASYRTAVGHVYAVGDVIGAPSLASSSMEQGRRAARHALGLDVGDAGALSPLGIYTIPEISSVGLTEDEARRAGGAIVGRANFAELARGQIGAVEEGLLKLVADARGERLLGVQVIGEGASELVHIGQLAMMGNLPVDTFVDCNFNFPTLAEAYRVAALDIAGRRVVSETRRAAGLEVVR